MENWIFYKNLDSIGHDIHVIKDTNIDNLKILAKNNNAAAFNSLGFIKSSIILPLTPSAYFGPEDGIYIRADIIEQINQQTNYTSIDYSNLIL